MLLGLSLSAFVIVHVIISLIAIASGFALMFGLLASRRMPVSTAIFLIFSILTSATGFMFPATRLLTSHIIGMVSLVLLAAACIALYAMKLRGPWRAVYVLTALISLYLNVFVLLVQGFLKIPALHDLVLGNPSNGPLFAVIQGLVLMFFVVVIVGAWRRFKPMSAFA
ncbi:MAG: hypothetical protein ACXWK2_08530 [Rhizomicrobium sp.]